jgi:ketosteroid isomerase-like protein
VSENLDLVRSIFANWERGDFSSADWAPPDIEFVIADGREPATWIGLEGMADGFRRRRAEFHDARVFADEYREREGERVLVLVHLRGSGRNSGLGLDQVGARTAHVMHLNGGRVSRLVVYWDRGRALADLGLRG